MKCRLLLGTLVVSLASCAGARDVELRTALREGEANELALVEEYKDDVMRVRGIVRDVGIKKQREERHTARAGFFYTATGETREVTAHYGYAVLAPQDGESGQALCFFNPSDRGDAAQLVKGQVGVVECRFQEFAARSTGSVLVLKGCRVP